MSILVTGGSGLVGNAIKNNINLYPNNNFIFCNSKDVDLTDFQKTYNYFKKIKPKMVIHLAACVGGLFKNMKYKVDMYEKNTFINLNVLKCCHEFNVEKVISCLSTCIFPDNIEYPINESHLHNGPPHSSNDAYAYSKRMLEIHSRCYREQYNRDYMCIIPTNIYGEHDNYSLEDGHVIPALIHQCYNSVKYNTTFNIKGTGKPLRQFIYSQDLAKLILKILFLEQKIDNIILSVDPDDEISIKDVVNKISDNYQQKNKVFNQEYSDGQYKKTASNSKLRTIFPNFKFTSFDQGLKNSIQWFNKNYETCRK